VAVQIDLKKHGALWEDFWDGLISESRRREKGTAIEKIKADLLKRERLQG
jgi:ribosomal protein S16